MTIDRPITFTIFGGTGDLTNRKLLPAFYNLLNKGTLPDAIHIIAIGRKDMSQEEYRENVAGSLRKFTHFQDAVWNRLKEKVHYFQFDFASTENFCILNSFLMELDGGNSERIYYLAVAPDYFEPIASKLKQDCMLHNKYAPRVVIEKPFGRDLASAQYLNKRIVSAFSEENTYRIDHYLGKEMLQNIMVIRFANTIFEPIWNHDYIEQVQILSSETLGVGARGGYYDKSGAARDMLQSHLLQLVSLIAMEQPKSLDNQAIRDEKVRVLRSLKPYSGEDVRNMVVRGQYGRSGNGDILSYREEANVSAVSSTETFIALKTFVQNERWRNVPFYFRTGKRMPRRSTEIIIEFRKFPSIYHKIPTSPNYLIFRIQPEEGVDFRFNAKEPGSVISIIPVDMDFCQNCVAGMNSPEAYERLLYDVMRGDATLFARWDEVENSWKFVDTIYEAWKQDIPDFPNYIANTWGPKEAEKLIEKDNQHWLLSEGENHETV
jgi:glucose-6-phosphate 1-dehydrogenase